MCNFFSCIVLKDGQVVWDTNIDSHDELLVMANIKDDTANPAELLFARVEIVPPDGDVFEKDMKKWMLKIDQSITPKWWNKQYEQKCRNALQTCLKETIIDNQDIDLIQNKSGLWIRNSKIKTIKNSFIRVMRGSSQVGEMRGSSQVREMRGSSQVGVMRGSSQVGVMRESSQVRVMWGSSQVREMRGSSQVGVMWESSQVRVMWESSQVGEMRGSSQVGEMRGSSQVGVMRGSSQVGEMRGSSQVNKISSKDTKFKIGENSDAIVIDRSGKQIQIISACTIKTKKYKEEV